jgi:hypothetical protein
MPTELPHTSAAMTEEPDTLHLNPSRFRWMTTLVVSLAIIALDLFLIFTQGQQGLWVLVVIFGFMAVLAISQFVPGRGGLTLDREGFTTRFGFYNRRRAWSDVTEIAASSAGLFQLVGYHLANEPKTKPREVLPETYGVGAQELGRLMNWWRDRALGIERHAAQPATFAAPAIGDAAGSN